VVGFCSGDDETLEPIETNQLRDCHMLKEERVQRIFRFQTIILKY
jgi:hypothetical protein